MSASEPEPERRVEGLKSAYLRPLGFPNRLLLLLFLVVSLLTVFLVARGGTVLYRSLAASGAVVSWVFAAILVSRSRAHFRKSERALFSVLRRVNSTEAARAVRAYETWKRVSERNRESAESPDLARIHVVRVLDGFPSDAVTRSVGEVRRRRMWLAAVLGGLCVSLFLIRPLALVEGVGVLLARRGVAPFSVAYVSSLNVTAEWPSYLDGTGKKRLVSSQLTVVPQGSEMEVRVVPFVGDRKLLLTDGIKEVPLLSDGQGGLVARWKAEDPAALRVAARFGDVLVFDGNETKLSPLDDRPPSVQLGDAPKEMKLDDFEELELSFSGSDDYGLTQLDLVLRSGQRESRIEIVSLDGRQRSYRGGYRLTREHEILRKAFLPVRVTVEARDNNVATGPSWGQSAAYTFIPAPLGEEVAERHVAFRNFRSTLASFVAEGVAEKNESSGLSPNARETRHRELAAALDELKVVLRRHVRVPQSSLAFMEAQLQALAKTGEERASPEAVLLGVDAMVHAVAMKEAQALSKDLGSAVEEIAVQSRELRFQSEGVLLEGVFDLVQAVEQGARQLSEVGVLGDDLGSVARGDLARIRRNLRSGAYARADASATHLAERLKRANASFSSVGGAGVESGSPSGGGRGSSGGAQGPASDSPQKFQDMAQRVDELAMDQAAEVSELERLLEEARRAAAEDFQSGSRLEEAADELRDALSELPTTGNTPGSPRAEAAQARSQGEAMADSLDNGDLLEALQRGLDAREALDRARELAANNPGWLNADDLAQAEAALKEVLEQAGEAAEGLKKTADSASQTALSQRAERQKEFAKRAEQMAKESKTSEAPLPAESQDALERAARLLRQAADALRNGRGDSGARYADEAHGQLERAIPSGDQSQGQQQAQGGDRFAQGQTAKGHVPEERFDQAKDFRRRVDKGLGRGGGRLAPAIRRYAEQLK